MEATYENLREAADVVNAAYQKGLAVKVAGREVWRKYRNPVVAQTWGNGSLSVDVRGASKGTQGTVWVKDGYTVLVEVTS